MMELFARETGGEGPSVVFLHGFGGSHRDWNPVMQALDGRLHLIAYDLPGHGRSLGWPGAGPAKVAARAVLADLERRDVPPAHLVGHSMGGAVAMLAGLFAPERVASLTLLSPGGFGPEINGRLLRRLAEARDAGTLRLLLENMFGWGIPVPEEAVESAMALRATPGQSEMLSRIAGAMLEGGVQGEIPRDLMERLAMPVDVVWGTRDNVLPAAQAERLPAHLRVRLVEGAGHMLHHEACDLVARLVREAAV